MRKRGWLWVGKRGGLRFGKSRGRVKVWEKVEGLERGEEKREEG